MASLSALGVGSGINAEALVSQLMSVERQPLDKLDTKESGIKSKISAFGTLKNALADLKDAASVLADANKLSAFKATPGDTNIATATATGSAAAGTYNLNVIRLATSHKVTSNANFSGSSAVVGAGTFSIDVGGTVTNIALTSGTATLSSLKEAINASGAGVTANIVTGDAGTKLVLSAKEGGKTVSVTATDDDLADGADFTQLSTFNTVGDPPQTAQVEIDGVLVSSNSNTITGALGGVTLNLAKAGTTTLTVARDSSTVKTAVENFVKAYNTLQSQTKTLTAYDPTNKKAAALTGDSAVRNMQSQISSVLANIPSGITGSYSRLSQLGVTVEADGKLALDSTKLQKAIDSDFPSVVNALNSYGSAFKTKATQLTDSEGILATRTDSLNKSIKLIGEQRDAMERRLEAVEKRYRAQFTALDTLVSGMQQTSTYLTQQLASLSK